MIFTCLLLLQHTQPATGLQKASKAHMKGACATYFGAEVASTTRLFTVVDPDVPSGYPSGGSTYIHMAGPSSSCRVPSPPSGCHRYFVVEYSSDCADLTNESLSGLSGQTDTQSLFSRNNGVLKSCASSVISSKEFCYEPPSASPTKCDCPA
eukprot:CAMPEP_0197527026 /NCGR_PEP_ID=MMETSP1318-20131121/20073_1 /TAXON_ID=552666 /ORGANISM="Partenskyella glossopodia, Strain RCC365" /LENGTH=151 /DNA_ID=CAMNT_0043081453 /DNA_START=151 /DNA_END=606 /DNA_ORIENTATION=+